MSETRAYDMSKYQRVIGFDGDRISGTFHVLASSDDSEAWVKPIDMQIWDEGHRSGRILYSNDLTASVLDGEADLREHMIASNKLADVQAVWDEMKAALVTIVEAFRLAAPVSTGRTEE
jgi:hypothetical protein